MALVPVPAVAQSRHSRGNIDPIQALARERGQRPWLRPTVSSASASERKDVASPSLHQAVFAVPTALDFTSHERPEDRLGSVRSQGSSSLAVHAERNGFGSDPTRLARLWTTMRYPDLSIP